mgnify:FL=1
MEKKKIIIGTFVALILIGAACAGTVYYYLFAPQFHPKKTVYIYIDRDDTADSIYNKVEQKLTRKVLENAGDEVSWRHGEFIFDDLPLQEIARELSNSFGATIHIADTALQNYRITARFRNGEDLTTILSVLHNAGYFDYSQNNKQIIITAKPD